MPGAGIVQLVQTSRPEIRLNLDEENLPSLRPGQKALITSRAYPGKAADGRVTAIGAQVDAGRGTVEVTVVPTARVPWLRPGQTVDISLIVTDQQARLVVPASAGSAGRERGRRAAHGPRFAGWARRRRAGDRRQHGRRDGAGAERADGPGSDRT